MSDPLSNDPAGSTVDPLAVVQSFAAFKANSRNYAASNVKVTAEKAKLAVEGLVQAEAEDVAAQAALKAMQAAVNVGKASSSSVMEWVLAIGAAVVVVGGVAISAALHFGLL